MYKISEFSKLSQVTVKALRLYDQMGLLKPAHVDPNSGYRYYMLEQLPQLYRILALKDLGLSLDQIGRLLSQDLPLAQIEGMLRLKQAELSQKVAEEQQRLTRVEARLNYLMQEETMPDYDVILKSIEPIRVVSIREILANYSAIGRLYEELFGYLGSQGVQPGSYCGAIWHDDDYKEHDVDGEALVSITASVPGTERIRVMDLPAVEKMACLVHQGSYDTLPEAYPKIISWIKENGYQITGPNREVYLRGGSESNNPDYITEIQFPVA